MTATLSLLALGLTALLVGGEFTVRGASGISRAFGIPAFVIGLTVVAFGTSAPELVVNLIGAYSGQSAIAFGNVVGSNLANIGLVLALSAMIASVHVQGSVIRKEVPLLLLVTAVLLVTASDAVLRGETPRIDRSDALVLLTLFAMFIYITVTDVLRQRKEDPLLISLDCRDPDIGFMDIPAEALDLDSVAELERREETASQAGEAEDEAPPRVGLSVLITVAGLVLLVVGGQLTIEYASALAAALGVSAAAIGIGVVAVGTSLPELITSGIAALRNEPDLAVGNVVGSNLFNTTFVLGLSALAVPLPVPALGEVDLIVNLLLVAILIPFVITGPRRLERVEGAALMVAYAGYLFWRFSQ
ncbi:MAG: calcium/sodium antiporter [Pseudomonadota bacterium]